MIKLPKKVIVFMFVSTFFSGIFFIYASYINSKNLEVFDYLSKVFLLWTMSGIFLAVNHRNGIIKPKVDNIMLSPYLTISILILSTLIFSFHILVMIKLGFGKKMELYHQIMTTVLAITTISVNIYNHLFVLKKQSNEKG